MRIVDSERVLFVHVPKTGGMTIQNVLESSGLEVRTHSGSRHHTLRTILLEEPALRDYWTFGLVRNPWERMLSWWTMIQRGRVARLRLVIPRRRGSSSVTPSGTLPSTTPTSRPS